MAELGIYGLLEKAFDKVSKHIGILDVVHRHVHDGEMYVANLKRVGVLDGAKVHLLIRATDKPVHFVLGFGAEGKCLFKTYEGTTFSDDGTAPDGTVLTTFNRVTSLDGMTALVTYDPTVDVLGTLRGNRIIFGGVDTPGNSAVATTTGEERIESVILPGDNILIEIENVSGLTIDIELIVDWYEN